MARARTRTIGTMTLAAALGLSTWRVAASSDAAEVMVYSARAHYGQEPAMEAFTRKTGIQVKSFGGEAGPLCERLKAEGDRTPADVLISVDAGHLWNAARAGLLSKVDSPELQANIPAHLRDPESRWGGLTVRARTIMYSTARVKPEELSTYEALGDPKWKGRLCLRTSTHIYNQSLIATMIKRYGEPKTEATVRAWGANNPTLINGDTKILEAVAAGQCDVALTNTYYLRRLLAKDSAFPVAAFWATQQTTGTHVNISGAGVTTHAKNRAEAIKLIEFLTGPEAQQMFADSNFEFPANPQPAVSRPQPRGWRIGPATSSPRVLARASAGSSLWAWTAIGTAVVVAVPIAAALSSLGVPSVGVCRHLWRTQLLELIANTLLLLLGVGMGTLLVGGGLAWLVVFHRFPGRSVLEWALILPLAVPAYVIGFIFLGLFEYAGPIQGVLRGALGAGARLPELRSYGGVVAMITLVFYPYVYLMARVAFREQGTAAVEIARTLGRSRPAAFLAVTVPMGRPALAAGVALAMMEALADFGTVATFGYRTLTEAIYRVWYGMFDRIAGTPPPSAR